MRRENAVERRESRLVVDSKCNKREVHNKKSGVGVLSESDRVTVLCWQRSRRFARHSHLPEAPPAQAQQTRHTPRPDLACTDDLLPPVSLCLSPLPASCLHRVGGGRRWWAGLVRRSVRGAAARRLQLHLLFLLRPCAYRPFAIGRLEHVQEHAAKQKRHGRTAQVRGADVRNRRAMLSSASGSFCRLKFEVAAVSGCASAACRPAAQPRTNERDRRRTQQTYHSSEKGKKRKVRQQQQQRAGVVCDIALPSSVAECASSPSCLVAAAVAVAVGSRLSESRRQLACGHAHSDADAVIMPRKKQPPSALDSVPASRRRARAGSESEETSQSESSSEFAPTSDDEGGSSDSASDDEDKTTPLPPPPPPASSSKRASTTGRKRKVAAVTSEEDSEDSDFGGATRRKNNSTRVKKSTGRARAANNNNSSSSAQAVIDDDSGDELVSSARKKRSKSSPLPSGGPVDPDELPDEWRCSANDALTFRLVRSAPEKETAQATSQVESVTFHPTFTHQLWDDEEIVGYKKVKASVAFTAGQNNREDEGKQASA